MASHTHDDGNLMDSDANGKVLHPDSVTLIVLTQLAGVCFPATEMLPSLPPLFPN